MPRIQTPAASNQYATSRCWAMISPRMLVPERWHPTIRMGRSIRKLTPPAPRAFRQFAWPVRGAHDTTGWKPGPAPGSALHNCVIMICGARVADSPMLAPTTQRPPPTSVPHHLRNRAGVSLGRCNLSIERGLSPSPSDDRAAGRRRPVSLGSAVRPPGNRTDLRRALLTTTWQHRDGRACARWPHPRLPDGGLSPASRGSADARRPEERRSRRA